MTRNEQSDVIGSSVHRFEESSVCPICGGATRQYSSGTVAADAYFAQPERYLIASGVQSVVLAVHQCERCGHGFSPVGVSEAVLQRWYEQAPADTSFLADEEARRRTARRVLGRLKQFVQPPGRLLDIGCGPGFFLDEARRGGWEVAGVEPSRWARTFAQERLDLAQVWEGSYERVSQLVAGSYDVVTAFDVIEHILEPERLLAAFQHVLRPGGVLVLTTPQFDSLVARIAGRRWYCIFPAHLHYFSTLSLQSLLERYALTPMRLGQHTRYLGVGYVVSRLGDSLGWQGLSRLGSLMGNRLVVPLRFGDEFEIYARRAH